MSVCATKLWSNLNVVQIVTQTRMWESAQMKHYVWMDLKILVSIKEV